MKTRSIRRARVGRKPAEGARHDCGKLRQKSDVERQADIKATALAARERVFGLTPKQADTQEGGSVVGRLAMAGVLGQAQQAADLVRAAEAFRERRAAMQATTDARTIATNTNYAGGQGGTARPADDPEYIQRCAAARARWAYIRRIVLECGSPLGMMAMEHCVINDQEPQSDPMVGGLRCALNAINRLLRFERRTA